MINSRRPLIICPSSPKRRCSLKQHALADATLVTWEWAASLLWCGAVRCTALEALCFLQAADGRPRDQICDAHFLSFRKGKPQAPSLTQSRPSPGAPPPSAVCSVQCAACSTGLQNRQPMRHVSMVIRLAGAGAHGSHSWRWPTPSAPVLCRTALPLTRPLPHKSACLASSLQPYQALNACRPFRQVGCVTRARPTG